MRVVRLLPLVLLVVASLPELCTSDFVPATGSIPPPASVPPQASVPPSLSVSTEEAPAFTHSVTEFFESATYLESVRACFPNSTSPFPQLDGPTLPQSHCLVAPGVISERVEQLGETLVQDTAALEELNRISKSGVIANFVMESLWVNGLLRTMAEVHFGRDHFGRNELKADPLKIKLWQIPSPIATPARPARGQETKLILGESCTAGTLRVTIGSPEQTRSLKAVEPNVSVIVASARVSDKGTVAISGAEFDEELWENKLAAAAAKMQGLPSQGPVYPRAHLLLYYRTDWFEELGVSVPNTWDELIALARTMSGLDSFVSTEGVGPNKVAGYENIESWPHADSMPPEPIRLHQVLPHEEDMGGNNTRFALCLDLAPYCQGAYVLNAILASISQTQGTWQNAFMDPVELELLPVKHPELMKEALQVYRDLAQASHLPMSLHSCSAVSHLFAVGRCAMTINWEHAFPYLYNSPRPGGKGNPGGSNSSKPDAAKVRSLVGVVGVSPLPGSSRMYDRAERMVKECDPLTCPLATRDNITSYSYSSSELPANANKASSSSSSSSSSQNAQSNPGGGEDGSERSSSTTSQTNQSNEEKSKEEQRSTSAVGSKQLVVEGQKAVWVNRSPYSVYPPAGLALCNPSLDEQGRDTGEYQTNRIAAASQALNNLAVPMVAAEMSMAILMGRKLSSLGDEKAILAYTPAHKGNLGTPADEWPARRQELLRPPDFSDQELEFWWRSPIYDINDYLYIDIADSRRFFQALWKASYVYQNQAPELLAMPTLTQGYRIVAAEVALYTASSTTFSLERAVQGFQNRSMDAQNAELADRQATQGAVWRATGFDRSMIDVVMPPSGSSSRGLNKQETAGAILGPVLFVFLVAILGMFLVVKRQRQHEHQNLFGVILPPKAGPQTTLLLTDIEGSTQMWETLPDHVCDEAISLHHEVTRKQLHIHYGYECGTEGDAFVLAFHTVADALVFAASAQVELLHADWPAQLLELEVCRPVYVPLPMTSHRRSSTSTNNLRKSDDQAPIEHQESEILNWSSQEVALTLEATSPRTPASLKQHGSNMDSASEASVRSTGRGFLSKLKACFAFHTLQQELQARSGQPRPLNTPRLKLSVDADDVPVSRTASRALLRGKSSGLLAFDAVLLSTAATNGNRSNERDDETGFKCTKLVKHRPSVTPVPTGSPNDSSNGFHFDPSMSTLNESSLTQNASALKGNASNEANTEQNSSRRVRFSLSELGCSSTFNSVDVCNSARLNSGSGRMPLSTVEPGCSSQEGSCVIDIPSTRQFVPESCNGGIIDNTKLTVGQQLLATMPRTHTPGPGQLLVLRGLRVRMGMASGVERQEDVHLNSAQGRVQYSGPAMAAAKAVVDAAQGGMVLISPETFQQIPAKLLREKILVASMGEHKLGKGQGQICLQLYQVLPRQLVHRAAQLGPVRSIQQLSHGFLEAPSNRAAICFMTVSYLKALELWNPDVTAAALELWQTIVQGILMKRGGYLVEAVDGLCLAAFTHPSSAIRWAVESMKACLIADWPPELLETELGEEHYHSHLQWRSTPLNSERDQQMLSTCPSMESAPMRRPAHSMGVLLFRGLRLKAGIDWGTVKADLHAATARVDFRGKVMNRAARISSMAKCGQVWCSRGAWEAAAHEINSPKAFPDEIIEETEDGVRTMMHSDEHLAKPRIQCVHATPLGPHQLKGIAQHVEIYHCY